MNYHQSEFSHKIWYHRIIWATYLSKLFKLSLSYLPTFHLENHWIKINYFSFYTWVSNLEIRPPFVTVKIELSYTENSQWCDRIIVGYETPHLSQISVIKSWPWPRRKVRLPTLEYLKWVLKPNVKAHANIAETVLKGNSFLKERGLRHKVDDSNYSLRRTNVWKRRNYPWLLPLPSPPLSLIPPTPIVHWFADIHALVLSPLCFALGSTILPRRIRSVGFHSVCWMRTSLQQKW